LVRGREWLLSDVAFAGNGLSHARCLLDKVGLPQVPVSDGDRVRTRQSRRKVDHPNPDCLDAVW
jgi:hypothetical protein